MLEWALDNILPNSVQDQENYLLEIIWKGLNEYHKVSAKQTFLASLERFYLGSRLIAWIS